MKLPIIPLIVALGFFLAMPEGRAAVPVGAPVTLRSTVRGRVVTVQVARGFQQVVLEQRSGTGWKPVAASHPRFGLRDTVKNIAFALPAGVTGTDIRAQGFRTLKFPARFTAGKRDFDRLDLSLDTGLFNTLTGVSPMAMPMRDATAGLAEQPAAVESDIWQIAGSHLFFFNQYRGLQVLDLTDPTNPVRTGTLRMPASGEQMYVLDEAGTQVVLLGRSNAKERQGAATIYLLRIQDGLPTLVGEMPLDGDIVDSRLIGSHLHVLCQVWATHGKVQQSGAVLTSVDVTELEAPKNLGSLNVTGTAPVLQAAEGRLLIGINDGAANHLHVVNVGAAPVLTKTLTTRGSIQDKFKMTIMNGAIVAVTQDWRNWSNRQTWVETFPLEGAATKSLAVLELVQARNEQLHATQFDGDRLYVVTFRQVDPLFVVNLADPAAPSVAGVLEVPGWSTSLHPLGGRLLAVGVEAGRVTVSLFDVSDAGAPALLSRLPLGPEGGSSWSEANYDEKAVEYLPDQGVVMVPFQTWEGGPQKAVQAIQVGADTLTPLVTIRHDFNPRRGGWIAGHFVSISGQELVVHDTEDNGAGSPAVEMSLAWRTDRVVPLGDYLVQIEDGESASGGPLLLRSFSAVTNQGRAVLRVTPSSDPDTPLEEMDLGPGRVVALTQRNDRLWLAQWVPATDKQPQLLRTRVLDLSQPPAISELTTVEHPLVGIEPWDLQLGAVQAVWTDARSLVWYVPAQARAILWLRGPIYTVGPINIQPVSISPVLLPSSPTPLLSAALLPMQPSPRLAALLCEVKTADEAAGIIALPPQAVHVTGAVRGVSAAFSDNGYLFFSYDTEVQKPVPLVGGKPAASIVPLRPVPARLRTWLQVVDFHAADPLLRNPVSIPGGLLSVAQADSQGAVILTNSDMQLRRDAAPIRVVQVSAYDGVSAWQLDSYITATPFHSATATDGVRLFLTRETGGPAVVAVGYNSTSGRLAQLSSWSTNTLPSMLDYTNGHLLASSYGNLEVASISSGGKLMPLASFDTPAILWLQVSRAAFTSTLDLWIPAGDYGVEFLQHQALETQPLLETK